MPVTNQTSAWSRLRPLHRAGIIVAALVLPCCGGLTVLGALAGDETPPAAAPGVQQLADGAPAATTATTPKTEKKTVTKTSAIKHKTRTEKDDSLPKGERERVTEGVDGVLTRTYEVTLVDGRETARRLVSSRVTRKPVTEVVAVGTYVEPEPEDDGGGDCTPGYDPCVPVASDVDCAGGSGNGPAYVDGPVRVTGSDPYDLDRDHDGIACDT
ncbi:hypothetical protein Asp14428_57220 [Actinoplanes sp. NBRC 14428]|nr:hypothetical protein Asp14428_57220 [Actinoplanes sp. NBRC 14428]